MHTPSANGNRSSAWTRNACLGPGACQRPGWARRKSAHPRNQNVARMGAKSSNRVGFSYGSSACCYAVAEIVEQRHAVRLGPHAHRARAGDMAVIHLDGGLAVEDHADVPARELHA